MNEISDEELVQLSLKDINHFTVLVERHRDKLLHYIQRVSTFPPEMCLEILQEGFMKIWKNLNNFDTKLKFITWAYRIMYTSTISMWRKEKKHFTNMNQSTYEIEQVPDPHVFDESEKVDTTTLHKFISELPFHYREVIILRYWENKTYEELSDILQKPKGSVATLLKRAKDILKHKIEVENER